MALIADFNPIADTGHTLKVYVGNGKYSYYEVQFVEAMNRGSISTINFGAPAGAATIAKAVQQTFQVDNDDLLELRCAVIDDVELRIWVPGGTPRFYAKNWHARVNAFSRAIDPVGKFTTHYIQGNQRDAQYEVINPRPTALGRARISFWGYHYKLGDEIPAPQGGRCTVVPAAGWGS